MHASHRRHLKTGMDICTYTHLSALKIADSAVALFFFFFMNAIHHATLELQLKGNELNSEMRKIKRDFKFLE